MLHLVSSSRMGSEAPALCSHLTGPSKIRDELKAPENSRAARCCGTGGDGASFRDSFAH